MSEPMSRGAVFLSVLLILAALPGRVFAQQQSPIPRVGLLMIVAGPGDTAVEAVRAGLARMGYVEGQNILLEYRAAEGHLDRLPALARDLVAKKVDALVVGAEASARAAQEATSSIPI